MNVKHTKINSLLNIIFAAILIMAGSFMFSLCPSETQTRQAEEQIENSFKESLPAPVQPLFEDYTMTKLCPGFDTEDKIEQFKSTIENIYLYEDYFARALSILKGEINFDKNREFSTISGRGTAIEQYGNVSGYSTSVLGTNYATSDLMVTGIYGLSGQKINVFVEAKESTFLPALVFTQNHGYNRGAWRSVKYLATGWNSFIFDDFVTGTAISQNEVKGGAIYIRNPYDSTSQQGDVSIYIEGGGFYPVYKLGDDKEKFLGFLNEYESKRSANPTKMLNLAELLPDYALFTTKSSVLYETYIEKQTIDPDENLKKWGEYFKQSLEFNGISTSPQSAAGYYNEKNSHIRINLRWMTPIPNSGAYATSYHIGFYDQHYWLANYYEKTNPVDKKNQLVEKQYFDIGHEVGHSLDVSGRTMAETTNNVNATFAYLKILGFPPTVYQPFNKTFDHLSSDYTLDYSAFDDGKILYTSGNYDHNYLIWWYLESVFPNYWADLNNIYRHNPSFYGNTTEKLVYYSCLVTKTDLSSYFERWGFYLDGSKTKFKVQSASENFKTKLSQAIEQGLVEERYNHFWYVDNDEYDFIRKNSEVLDRSYYNGGTPQIVNIKKSGNSRMIAIDCAPDPNLLGYEILSSQDGQNYKIAGFTYSNTFNDTYSYADDPYYKVLAVNRFFATSPQSQAVKEVGNPQNYGVCRIGENRYNSLDEAVSAIKNNTESENTIYLLSHCTAASITISQEITIKIAPEITSDIYITNSGNSMMFHSSANFSLIGNARARIVIDGGSILKSQPAIYAGSGKFEAQYVTFQNCHSGFLGGAIASIFAQIKLSNCTFSNCFSGSNNSAINMTSNAAITIENTVFSNQKCDIYFNKEFNLTFAGSIPKITLDFAEPAENKYIFIDNFAPSKTDLENIVFANTEYTAKIEDNKIKISLFEYTLTFNYYGSQTKKLIKNSIFTFGDENLQDIKSQEYIFNYVDASSGQVYLPGQTIELEKDMTFNLTFKDKLSLTLQYFDEQSSSTILLPENEHIYLPRFDNLGREIFAWSTQEDVYKSGDIYIVTTSQVLQANYVGYLRCDFFVKDNLLQYCYKKYDEELTTPSVDEEKFVGWQVGTEIVPASYPFLVKTNSTFIALFDEEGKTYDLTQAQITILDSDFIYTGSDIKPKIQVTLAGEILASYYYITTYSNNLNVGIATITITPRITIVIGEQSITFTILPKELSKADVRIVGLNDLTYTGTQTSQNISVWIGSTILDHNSMSISYQGDRINVGTVNVILSFNGNYCGQIMLSYQIKKAAIANRPKNVINVTYDVQNLSAISLPDGWRWQNNTMALQFGNNSAMAIYRDEKNYLNPTQIITISRAGKNISSCTFPQIEDEIFDGTSKTPTIEIWDGDYLLKENEDYTLTYQNNSKVGLATVIIKGKNAYSGEKILHFNILPNKKLEKNNDLWLLLLLVPLLLVPIVATVTSIARKKRKRQWEQ